MILPQVESSYGKHRKTWTSEELEAQEFEYRFLGGFPIPTGLRRANIMNTVRSTK
ncbi:hypothetical protein [Arthrobacter bambusae]|uniref:hypothetical protein n=1 Tax=Arthrobacter bambusae TaxID=1338426 RepID=UPI0027875F25|nr:hypothetical protein [Arthrobacter bambusae]MDQ0241239.1 hypothetical protein [Arthrobacter bambusae]